MAFLLLLLLFGLNLATAQELDTTHGRLRGERKTILDKSVDAFLGIPFAKPPVGDLRFKHPKPADPWRPTVKDATIPSPSCIQDTVMFGNLPPENPARISGVISEDCLYLNIWKPASASPGSNKAVMVWFYGGGFSVGSISQPMYNGQYLAAENDVIVVSINYRIGFLGFGFLGPDTIPGNMGMMDQVEGLKWIQNNIENFGGDKKRITLFGQSAGAFSIGFHLVSPLSQNLFNNAILESGSPVNNALQFLRSTKPKAKENLKKLAGIMQCRGSADADLYSCLMSADAAAITDSSRTLDSIGFTFVPIYDGYFLPEDPVKLIEEGKHKKTNLLTGVTKDEFGVFLSFLLNPVDLTLYTSGEIFSSRHFESALGNITGLQDLKRSKAIKTFYESEPSPAVDYLEALSNAGSDLVFKCPVLHLSSLYAESNDVYFYSLNYRVSNQPLPQWMGVPHGFDVYLVFGLPLNDSYGYNDDDKALSRVMRKYWTNFAKTGNPNLPEQDNPNWPVFNNENLTYMALDVGSNLATRHGFRRHQCAFMTNILPDIPQDADTLTTTTTRPYCRYPVSGGKRQCPGCVYVILSLLTVFFRILQG